MLRFLRLEGPPCLSAVLPKTSTSIASLMGCPFVRGVCMVARLNDKLSLDVATLKLCPSSSCRIGRPPKEPTPEPRRGLLVQRQAGGGSQRRHFAAPSAARSHHCSGRVWCQRGGRAAAVPLHGAPS